MKVNVDIFNEIPAKTSEVPYFPDILTSKQGSFHIRYRTNYQVSFMNDRE